MSVSDLKELHAMREEIVRLKLKVADLTMDRDILKEILGKKP